MKRIVRQLLRLAALLVLGAAAWAQSGAGLPVVGWNSLSYYWVQRTPEEAARDLERILAFYLDKWRKTGVVLVGYSRGADVLPFLASRLPLAAEVQKLRGLRVLGVYGSDETDSLCKGAAPGLLECVQLAGGHHFGGSYAQIAERILAEL